MATRQLLDHLYLRRATNFLQKAFFTYREVAFDLSIEKLQVTNNILVAKEGSYDEVYAQGKLLAGLPFKLLQGQEPWVKDMVLSMMACSDMLVAMEKLNTRMLKSSGIAKKIEEISMIMRPGPRSWTLERPSPLGTQTSKSYVHAVYRVTLKDGSVWALDLTSSQYGYNQNLVAWQEYVRDRVDKILEIHPLGYSRATMPTFANDLSTAVAVAQFRAAKGIEDTIIDTFGIMHLTEKDFLTNTSDKRFKEVTRQVLAVASKTVHYLEAEMAKQNRKTMTAVGGMLHMRSK